MAFMLVAIGSQIKKSVNVTIRSNAFGNVTKVNRQNCKRVSNPFNRTTS